MRTSLAVLAAAVALPLGAVQALASLALADRALPGSWPAAFGGRMGALVAGVPPTAPLPLALRIVLARDALAAGDVARGAAFAATLPPGDDRLVLEGDIARARGDFEGAAQRYVAAGDLDEVAEIGSALAGAGRIDDALALERAVVARLLTRRASRDTLADSYYRVAELEQVDAYQHPPWDPQREAKERLALADYQRAASTAPLALRYAIALGNQQLNLGDLAAARAEFVRARALDATSVEPLVGLGDAALRAGDKRNARAYLQSAQALAPGDPAVRRLAAEVDGVTP